MEHLKITAMEVIEGHDLTNLNYIITGGSASVGLETARALAKAGARVILAVRDTVKGDEIASELRKSTNNTQIYIEPLKLDSFESINSFVKRFLAFNLPLHCLINNSKCKYGTKSFTAEGFEKTFGVNYLGHFALTIGLLPALLEAYQQTGRKSRVINLSSIFHGTQDIDFTDINYDNHPYNPIKAIGQACTARILFSVALTQLYSSLGVVSNAVMPGFVGGDKEIDETQPKRPKNMEVTLHWSDGEGNAQSIEFNEQLQDAWASKEVSPVAPLFRTPEQGASTVVWAAVAPELEGVGGMYLENCGFSNQSSQAELPIALCGYTAYAVDKENALKLWDLSMDWINNPPKNTVQGGP